MDRRNQGVFWITYNYRGIADKYVDAWKVMEEKEEEKEIDAD